MKAEPRTSARATAARVVLAGSILLAAALTPTRMQAQTVVTNTASATLRTVAGTDSVVSNTVSTTLLFPDVSISKRLDGPTLAHIGQTIQYTIQYRNASSDTEARDVLVIDTLAPQLEFVSSQPSANLLGQVVHWDIGDLAPGDSAEIGLTVRVREDVQDTVEVRNSATLTALNTAARAAVASPVQIVGLRTTQLALRKSSDVLEAGIGESVPYAIVLENSGVSPISDLWIFDVLPDGTRFGESSLTGADSTVLNGRNLTIRVPGTIPAGGSKTVRYAVAIVEPNGDVLANRAYATAENGFIQSEEAVAWVRIRRQWPMETRTVIGKIWLDLDADGLQDPGEPGVEGVDVWTDDGEVATTDQDGKYSFRNVRPGRHAFRLDQTTLPAMYRLNGSNIDEHLKTLDVDGWTTPRVNFRVTRSDASVERVHLPITTSLRSVPLCLDVYRQFPDGKPIVVAHFREGGDEPQFVIDPSQNRDRLFGAMAASAACPVEIAGHTDKVAAPTSASADSSISLKRARAVLQHFRRLELLGPYVIIRGYGTSQPIASGTDVLARQLNRRVELRLVRSPTVEHSVQIGNTNRASIDGLVAEFTPPIDSAIVLNGGEIVARNGDGPLSLPPVPPDGQLTIRAWSNAEDDSAAVVLQVGTGEAHRLSVAVSDSSAWVHRRAFARGPSTTLPDPETIDEGTSVELLLAPTNAGNHEMTYALPTGWEHVDGDTAAVRARLRTPLAGRDQQGNPILHWSFRDQPATAVTVQLKPVRPMAAAALEIPALRTAEDRAAEKSRAFVAGPGVEIFDPVDGRVFPSDRVYVGVRGEPGQRVELFSGDSLLAGGTIRADGIHDFIAVPLARGPHTLRLRMLNSWNQERWDSMAVHVSGAPAKFVGSSAPIRLLADGQTLHEFRMRLVDQWDVPIAAPTYVTVEADGADPAGTDDESTSVGLQVQSDRQGWVTVRLKPGRDVGTGTVTLTSGKAVSTRKLEILPAIRPLMVTGVGRVGIGASPDPFGAITARGRLGARTALVMSYDSRLLNAGQEAFGRSFDPLGDTQYPILGDAGQQRSTGASRYAFSARVERGFDWLALGDIPTTDFAAGLNLTTYRRALTGGAIRLTTGLVEWRGFGSVTRRQVMQTQIRGAGASGPYQLERDLIVGTEEIALETRARENAQRILTRQVLIRFVDYQIDYERGTLLFKRPVPAADPQENPVFIMLTYETEGGGDQRLVGGLRASIDAQRFMNTGLDSLRIGATGIRSDEGGGSHSLAGLDVRALQFGGLDVGAEVSYSSTPDSSGFAATVDGGLKLLDGVVDLAATWMRIDAGFSNPSKTSLRGGTEDVKLRGGIRVAQSELRLRHERQSFSMQGVERRRTHAGIIQHLGSALQIDAGHASDQFINGAATDRSQAGEVKITWTASPALTFWSQGRRQFAYQGNVIQPDHVAAGAAFQVHRGLSIELQHRQVFPTTDARYSVTNLGLRSNLGASTQAWGSYQLAGAADGRYNAAVIGLNNQLRVGPALTLNALFERREGLDNASLTDPVRALPFVEAEEDYWTAGLGIELLPREAPYRLTARGELRNGDVRSTRLLTLAGDVSFGRSLAALSRQELLRTEQQLSGTPQLSRRLSTLWGLAFRPAHTDRLNMLAKFQWVDETNPLGGGVLTRRGAEERLIGSAEMIWAPTARSEVAWRYAIRRTVANGLPTDGDIARRESWADYIGGRLNLDVNPWLAFRTESRLLLERTSGTQRWDAAPSLVVLPVTGLEVGGGYRFGDLQDPDFAVRGGHGWFLTFGARVTERIFPTALDFWRTRF